MRCIHSPTDITKLGVLGSISQVPSPRRLASIRHEHRNGNADGLQQKKGLLPKSRGPPFRSIGHQVRSEACHWTDFLNLFCQTDTSVIKFQGDWKLGD